jgi:hypothetical protein
MIRDQIAPYHALPIETGCWGEWRRSMGAGEARPKFADLTRLRQVLMHPKKYRTDNCAGGRLAEQPRTQEYHRGPRHNRHANHCDRSGNPEGVKAPTNPRPTIRPVSPCSTEGAQARSQQLYQKNLHHVGFSTVNRPSRCCAQREMSRRFTRLSLQICLHRKERLTVWLVTPVGRKSLQFAGYGKRNIAVSTC